nr:hypothetical protein [uncultured Hydrogenophaga sp.]
MLATLESERNQFASGLRAHHISVDLLEDFDIQIAIGQQLIQPRVLDFQCLQAFDVSDVHPYEVPAPGVDAGIAGHVLRGGLGRAGAHCFSQERDYLLFAESALSHGLLASSEPSL